MILIGSRALSYWTPDFKCKPDADWDIIGEPQEVNLNGRIEWHSPKDLNNKDVERLFTSGHYLNGVPVCSRLGLSLIKRSHLWRDYSWDKHITHYHKYMYPDSVCLDNKFLVDRIRLTKEAFPQGNPNLMQTNEEFFDDAVGKVYDHDWLHELYAYGEHPLYERLKTPEGMGNAWCSRDLWEILTTEEKNKCVAEESYVIATERFLVPSGWSHYKQPAYLKALKKVCTTLTSGWFRDWAIDNHPEICKLYNVERINKVEQTLKDIKQ